MSDCVVGLDISSHSVDLVKLPVEGGDPEIFSYSLYAKGNAFDRARMVSVAMPAKTSEIWDDVLAIGIEEPYGKGLISTMALYRVQGATLNQLPQSVLVEPFSPSRWKRGVGLSGSADKEAVAAFVRARVTLDLTQDQCDAYCIALAMSHALER